MKRLSLGILVCLMLFPVQGQPAGTKHWTNDQAMLFFFEAVTQIKRHSLDARGAGPIVQDAVQAFLKTHDPYGEYLNPEAYRAWKASQNYRFFGVGMELISRNNRFFLIPRPHSPAQTAGIRGGDELLAVDGKSVAEQPLHWVGSRIRGKKNTRVSLKMIHQGRIVEVAIFRQPMKDQSVWPTRSGEFLILGISHFSPHTLAELKAALKPISASTRLVLDLRNNPGGDLFAAVDASGLFLAPGTPVLTLETQQDKVTYRAKGQIWKGGKCIIWQNGFTASAAEVLTRALTANHRAVNMGQDSFGKALTQKVVELSDGSALVLSRGRLYGPGGHSWQGEGIQPAVKLNQTAGSWVHQTRQHLNKY